MNPHDATEQAYRNGYDAGYKAAKEEYFDLTPKDVAYLVKFYKYKFSFNPHQWGLYEKCRKIVHGGLA